MAGKRFQKLLKVTFIIPHLPHTREEYLIEAIRSAEQQTYKNIEIILVGKNQKGYANINDGLKIATGDIIHILHDDDYLTLNSAEIAVNKMKHYDFIHGDIIRDYNESGRKIVIKAPVEIPTFKGLIENNTIQVASVYYKKEALESIGGWPKKGGELVAHLELLKSNKKIGYTNEIMSYYRKHSGQFGKSEEYIKNSPINRPKIINEYRKHINHDSN